MGPLELRSPSSSWPHASHPGLRRAPSTQDGFLALIRGVTLGGWGTSKTAGNSSSASEKAVAGQHRDTDKAAETSQLSGREQGPRS